MPQTPHAAGGWRHRLFEIIFEADTPAGKLFDVLLIVCIVLSVTAVMCDSMSSIHRQYGGFLYGAEWAFTVLFTIEYVLRLLCVRSPLRYGTSFFGLVDMLSILPTYMSLFVPGSQAIIVIRIFRVLRVFRVLKIVEYIGEAEYLRRILLASRRKIIVFLVFVVTLVIVMGSLMYLVEGEENGFTSIPRSVYWAVVTLTTVGYGDISPKTGLGQFLAAIIMILGYSIIAVPTGIVTAEMTHARYAKPSTQVCPACSAEGHDQDAKFCNHCGAGL